MFMQTLEPMFDRIRTAPASAETQAGALPHISVQANGGLSWILPKRSRTLETQNVGTRFPFPSEWPNVPSRTLTSSPMVAGSAATRLPLTVTRRLGGRQQATGNRHVVLGHRAAWVSVHGQVPMGMTIDHLCKQRRCVNPDHLRLLPNYENARRTGGRDWPMGYCANGHDATHLYRVTRSANASGFAVICRTCTQASRQRYQDRKKEVA